MTDKPPLLLVDGFEGWAIINDTVRINLVTNYFDAKREVVKQERQGTIAIPIGMVPAFLELFTSIQAKIEYQYGEQKYPEKLPPPE